MRKILITGAKGFVGKHLVDAFFKQPYLNQYEIFQYREDITDSYALSNFFSFIQPDYVYHLASASSDKLSHYKRAQNYAANIVGTANIVNCCVNYNVKRLIFTSSNAVYNPELRDCDETTRDLYPMSPYGVAKLASEFDIINANRVFDLPYTILRLHSVYGPDQKYLFHKNIMSNLIHSINNGIEIPIYGDGNQYLQFTYVEDLVEPMIKLLGNMHSWNQIYNFGSQYGHSLLSVVNKIEIFLNKKAKINFIKTKLPIKSGHILHFKEREDLVWDESKETSIQVGISKCCQEMEQICYTDGAFPPKPDLNLEILKNIPENWK